MLTDYHLHTTFSNDGKQTPDELCRTALEKGLTYIAITDHMDLIPNSRGVLYNIKDPEAYIRTIDRLRSEYPRLTIQRGMELGYVPGYGEEAARWIERIKPDFVLGSLHLIDGIDPYEPVYYEHRTRTEAYKYYIECLIEAIPRLAKYCQVLAHLDYCSKFSPFPDPELRYNEFPETMDECLKALIESGMALEINTSGYRRRPATLPGPSILRRYYMLGGRRICFGSDGHQIEFDAFEMERAQQMARDIGFTQHSVWINGKERMFHL